MGAQASATHPGPASGTPGPSAPQGRELPRWAILAPVAAGSFAALVGVAVLVGWALDVEALKTPLPGQVAMKANTAAGFVMLGIAVVLLGPESAGPRRRLAGRVIALVASSIGLLTLGEYVFGWDLGIDQLLFREAPGAVFTSFPGRMSWLTATCFVVLGGVVVFGNTRSWLVRHLLDLASGGVAILCLLIIVPYLYGYGARPVYLTIAAGSTPMAFPTALTLLVLVVGVRLARPVLGLGALAVDPGPGGVIVRQLVPTAIVSMFVLGYLSLWVVREGFMGHEAATASLVAIVVVIAILAVGRSAGVVDRSERGRRLAEAEGQLFFDVSLDMLCLANLDGYFVRLNPAWERTLGWSVKELKALPFVELVHPDDRETTIAEAARLGLGDDTVSFENRYRCEDGSYKWLAWSVAGVPERGLLIAAARDITERKQAEEEMSRLASIVSSTVDAVYSKDLDGTITTWNRGAEVLYGFSAAEAIGQPISIIDPGDRPGEISTILEKVRRGETVEPHETVRRTKDGRLVDISVTVSPLKDTGGGVTGTSVIGRDITERRRTEELLARQRVELERSNADLERFAYVASHDLQEPLRMVSSFVDLLAQRYRGRLDADADEFIGFAVDGAKRMSEMINDLLTYSRIGRGGDARPVDCEQALERAMRNLVNAIDEAGAVVTHDPLPMVMADPSAVTQLLQNLIGNAVKFRRDGQSPRVHIGAQREANEWVVSVRDNGVGIADADRGKVFEIFRRLHPREGSGGTGIGLAICERIVHAHGGRIWVESGAEPGAGSTFSFALAASDGD